MSLPYEDAQSGERAIDQIRRILTTFGCNKFGTMTDTDKAEVLVQFEYRGRPVSVNVSAKGYAAAWLREHPYNGNRHRKTLAEYERKALDVGQVAVYSILRDWIKGQIMAVECGVLTFEGAFLGQLLLPNGKTVLDEAVARKLLSAPEPEKVVPIK